ncbi:MAG: hypothetical protein ABL973_12010 [Micropepsaceae bacterium]
MSQSQTSVLPENFRQILHRVGQALEEQRPLGREFDGVLDALNGLEPSTMNTAEREIVNLASLNRGRRKVPFLIRAFSRRIRDMDQLDQRSDLKFLFLFHRDGMVREQALRRISEPLPSAFLFAAVARRLNDWVPSVRQAAAECGTRCFARTQADCIAQAALPLLARENSWGRWSGERDILAQAFARPDVGDALAMQLQVRTTGPLAKIMNYALRYDNLDRHLDMLARKAMQPAIRATAAQALIDGHAQWQTGWTWAWIDKPMGLRRREPVFATRPLTGSSPRMQWVETCVADRSAMVRRMALDALIRHKVDQPEARRIAEPFLKDASAPVRERAEFIVNKTAVS